MATYVNESFTLLKFGQISICQNQKLQIPIFIVYKAPDVQSTKIKCGSSVTEICHEIAWQPFKPRYVFLSSFSLLYFVNQVVAQMPWVVSLHTRPYVPFAFMYIFNLFIFLFFFNFIFWQKTLTLPCHLRFQNDSVKSRGVSKVFLDDKYCGVTCVQNNPIKGNFSFLQLFLKLLLLVK